MAARNPGRPPNVLRHQEMLTLRASGLTHAEIGRRLGVSRQAVSHFFRTRRLPTRRHRTARGAKLLSVEQILTWAATHQARHGRRPSSRSGQVDRTDETWSKVDQALRLGYRGLPGGSSLARLLDASGPTGA